MNSKIFSMAMGELNDKYVSEAMNYQGQHKKNRWIKYAAAAACLCLILAGILPFTKHQTASPFVLIAYAYSEESHQVSTATLEEGQKIPVSIFYSTNGVPGFLLSYESDEHLDGDTPSICIITSEGTDERVGWISGVDLDPTQNYYFFVPAENETAAYQFPMFLTDRVNNLACGYEISISVEGDQYYAEILEKNIWERKFESD